MNNIEIHLLYLLTENHHQFFKSLGQLQYGDDKAQWTMSLILNKRRGPYILKIVYPFDDDSFKNLQFIRIQGKLPVFKEKE